MVLDSRGTALGTVGCYGRPGTALVPAVILGQAVAAGSRRSGGGNGRAGRRHAVAPFFLVVLDRTKRQFAVVGPMTDDTVWVERVVAAQREGREVNCFSVEAAEVASSESLAADYAREHGHVCVPPATLDV